MHLRTPLKGFNVKTSFAPCLEYGVFDDFLDFPFEHMNVYSPVNAWYMAECSRLAYGKDNDVVSGHLDKVGMHSTKFWDIHDTQVFVSWNDYMVWLSCTGTELDEGTADILVDLQAWPEKFQNGDAYVHSGFQRALNYVLPQILKFVNDLLETRRELYLTGHSLGGALALLFGTYFENMGTYVFGCPRTFSKKGAELMKGPVFRIEELHDIVTRIPLPPVFRHVGDSYFIDDDGNFLKNPNMWTRTKERLGDDELTIAWNFAKIILLKGAGDALLTYLHGHSPYNYSVYCWNNLVRLEDARNQT